MFETSHADDVAFRHDPDVGAPRRRRRPGRIRRALGFARPHRAAVAGILTLTLTAAAAGALEPFILREVLDALASRRDLHAAVAAAVGIAVALLVREVASALATFMTWRTRLRIHYSLLDATVGRLHRLPLDFHRSQGVGATMTKLDRGIQGFVGALGEIAFNMLPAIAYLGFAIGLMLTLDWRLTLVVVACAPIPAIIAAKAAPVQSQREERLLERWSRIYSRFNEVLLGIVTVRSFAMEDVEKRRFLGETAAANEIVVRGVGFDARVAFAQNLSVAMARVIAIGSGAFLVARGDITIGTLMAFVGYVGGAFAPVQNLAVMYKTLQTARVALDTVFGILDAQEHIGDAPDAVEVAVIRGAVDFQGVRFGYRPGAPILDGVDLHVEPGEHVAIVGPSGSGKSTLMALLQRFYDPWEGAVRVDGIDVKRLKQVALRRQIGVVLQEPVLFNDTIAANIAYGRPEADLDEIREAAAVAHADVIAAKMPDGYDTKVGERGALLSGGERQRVAIARALLKDPAILILDEATSALDAESEALVQDALEKLEKGRTTIVIAHRLSTVVNADRIVVLRKGRIVETGRHEDLVRAGGYYASLVAKQSRGLLPDRDA